MKMKKLLQNAIKRNFKARTSQGFHVSLRFAQNNYINNTSSSTLKLGLTPICSTLFL